MRCPDCGNIIKENVRSCPNCGRIIRRKGSSLTSVEIGIIIISVLVVGLFFVCIKLSKLNKEGAVPSSDTASVVSQSETLKDDTSVPMDVQDNEDADATTSFEKEGMRTKPIKKGESLTIDNCNFDSGDGSESNVTIKVLDVNSGIVTIEVTVNSSDKNLPVTFASESTFHDTFEMGSFNWTTTADPMSFKIGNNTLLTTEEDVSIGVGQTKKVRFNIGNSKYLVLSDYIEKSRSTGNPADYEYQEDDLYADSYFFEL